jgi:Glycosyl transferase family 2
MMSNSSHSQFPLISHVNGDGDLLEAWFNYYMKLGIDRFHIVVHGSREENAKFFELEARYPIEFEGIYAGVFDVTEKKKRLDAVLARSSGKWVMLVDSDEFVELPYLGIPETVKMLKRFKANTLFAPMLQRLNTEGSLIASDSIEDPFRTFPLCSVDLYEKMGNSASIYKFPLFYCTENTRLQEGGNHHPPNWDRTVLSPLLGVTHHFKFRRSVLRRLDARINSQHPWRHESVRFEQYLDAHSQRLPTEGAFIYSRDELFRRGLLRKLNWYQLAKAVARTFLKKR